MLTEVPLKSTSSSFASRPSWLVCGHNSSEGDLAFSVVSLFPLLFLSVAVIHLHILLRMMSYLRWPLCSLSYHGDVKLLKFGPCYFHSFYIQYSLEWLLLLGKTLLLVVCCNRKLPSLVLILSLTTLFWWSF